MLQLSYETLLCCHKQHIRIGAINYANFHIYVYTHTAVGLAEDFTVSTLLVMNKYHVTYWFAICDMWFGIYCCLNGFRYIFVWLWVYLYTLYIWTSLYHYVNVMLICKFWCRCALRQVSLLGYNTFVFISVMQKPMPAVKYAYSVDNKMHLFEINAVLTKIVFVNCFILFITCNLIGWFDFINCIDKVVV